MNILRGDWFRLQTCVNIVTGSKDTIERVRPFKYIYQKEIVLYAYLHKLDYFATECTYAPNSYRGYVRELLKKLEKIRPSVIIDIIHSAEMITVQKKAYKKAIERRKCKGCGFYTSKEYCQACVLIKKIETMAGTSKSRIRLQSEESSEIR